MPIGARRSSRSWWRGAPVRDGLETALDALCLSEIARFKRPKAYFLVDALPKNNTGKVLKTELRNELAKGKPGSAG